MYVLDFLRTRRVWFETLLHAPASSATRRAGAIHVSGRGVAKTVLVTAGGEHVLTVLPATSRVDLDRLAAALQRDPRETRLATVEEIDRVFHDCEPGAIPPFGRLYGLRTIVDAGLRDAGVVIFTTNTRHQGLKMHVRDYEGLEEPQCAEFGQPAAGRRTAPARPSRRAG